MALMKYQERVTCSLRVYDELVVLPESNSATSETTSNTGSSGGVIDTTPTFNCSQTNLHKGSRGDEVKKLQTILKARGYYTRQIDGVYGNYTSNAVKKLQKVQGNTQDGVFGPKTCNKLQNTSNIQAFNTTQDVTKKNNTPNSFLITNIKTSPSISYDLEGLSYEIGVNIPYTLEVWKHLRQLQKTHFTLYHGSTIVLEHEGYINSLKISNSDSQNMIEVGLVGYTAFLEQGITIEKTATRQELYETLIRSAGLQPVVNMTGLVNDQFTLKSTSDTTSSSSDVTLNGNDCTETLSISARSFDISACKGDTKIGNSSANYATDTKGMSAKDAIMSIYNRFKYSSYSNNKTCPRAMWNKNGTIRGNCADISRLVKCVGEVHGLRVGIRHATHHYYNLIEVNGQTYRFDCCFKSGTSSSRYGGEQVNTLSMRGGPWS